jgi:hypothetical protein
MRKEPPRGLRRRAPGTLARLAFGPRALLLGQRVAQPAQVLQAAATAAAARRG